ncbi:MAG TPA: high-potential iron-sulfur protein [Steroidobacteraceae bacterium]|nr:high-potential iron-sulfur protein [Steroidobacteraceae bacterium]
MSQSFSRRDALKGLALVVSAAGAATAVRETYADAAAMPHLDPKDPTAQALHYHENAKTVDAKAFPTYAAGQMCSTCAQLQGKAGDPWRPCNIFAGKLVNANGWCQVWVKKA